MGILGPLQVAADGQAVEVGGARLRALLIRLALDAGRPVTAQALADALWDDAAPADRANAVQSLVSRLRRVLPASSVVRSGPDGYRLDLPPDAVDAVQFERLADAGRRALRTGDPATAASRLREALSLWRGRALADVADARYAAAPAARLEELRLAATEDRIEAELLSGRQARLVADLEELTAAYPLRERMRGLLVKALYGEGRQAEALASYEEFRARLADELGADPSPELRDIHLAVLRGDAALLPAASPAGRPGNLPAPLTSFVGRETELARIGGQLPSGRLVTLVGAGGAGKTRLATTFAAGLVEDTPGGVWLVELSSVTDPAELPQAVLAALGVREASALDPLARPRDPMSRLVETLSAAKTLVVLDNCEHLVDAAARLVEELLERCPWLLVLATSREPLGILGEVLCPVPPLGLPNAAASAVDATAFPAVRLFADRVAAVRPDFAVTEGNVATVVEICRRLDGLPLAIELAAARLRSLPLEQLIVRLDDRFRLLTGGSRTALPRHRTLQAVVAWSWDLLDSEERRLAQRLAVFPGTITPESAEQVCGSGPTSFDRLTALVDKSLLQLVDGPEPRYRMLETIREYGRQRLAESGDAARARSAHAGYFRDLAERAEPHLRGAGQLPWIRRLAAERDNLLAALHVACDAGDAETAVRLGAALGPLWTIQGRHEEAASWLLRVLDMPGDPPGPARAAATAFCLLNAVLCGDHTRAQVATQGRPGGLPPAHLEAGHPAAVLLQPAAAVIRDDIAGGLAAVDQRLGHPDPWARGMLRLIRSFLDGNQGDMDGMRGDLAAAAEDFRDAGERWGLATALTYLGYIRIMLGDFDAAIAALEESTSLLHELEVTDAAVLQRTWIADARRRKGDVGRARAELLELVGPGAQTSPASDLIFARIALGDIARDGGDLPEAARQYAAAADDLERAPSSTAVFRAILGSAMGHLAVARGEVDAARRHLAEAFALAVEAPDMPLAAVVGVAAAGLCLREGAADRAAEVLGAAHALRGAADAFNPDVVRLAERLRGELGESAYQADYARGCGLTRADAIAVIEGQLRRR